MILRVARAYWLLNARVFAALVRVEPLLTFATVTALYVAVSMGAAAAGHDVLVFNLAAALGLPCYGAVCAQASRQRRLARARTEG